MSCQLTVAFQRPVNCFREEAIVELQGVFLVVVMYRLCTDPRHVFGRLSL